MANLSLCVTILEDLSEKSQFVHMVVAVRIEVVLRHGMG
jgi:hypothetical protein